MIEAFIAWATLALRIAAIALALWNLKWSGRSIIDLPRGRFTVTALYESVVAGTSVSVLCFQIAFVMGSNAATKLLAYILLTAVMTLAAMGQRLGASYQGRGIEYVHEHLEVALAIVDLAKVDPDRAIEVASLARRLTAERINGGR